MSEYSPHEDPVEHASTKVAGYVSVVAMAAEAIAQVAAARARERAENDERTTAALRAQRQTAYGQARLSWSPVLDPRSRERTTVTDAGTAWATAQAWRPDPEAERVTALAEERLHQLRPDVMDRYDRLQAEGADPVEAMRRVAPFFDQPPARTGQAAPERTALAEANTAERAAAAELTLDRGQSAAAGDDPATHRVDEHADALVQAHPHLVAGAGQDIRARSATAVADRTAAVIAAEGFPAPITAASIDTARAAVATPPTTAVTAAAQRTAVHRSAATSSSGGR
jgi:hypothetical protein